MFSLVGGVARLLTHGRQLPQQFRQCCLQGVPHDIKVDIKVAMSDAVAHASHAAPWLLRVHPCELGIAVHHLCCDFANDDEAHDDSLLCAFVL